MDIENFMYDDQFIYCIDATAEEPIMLLQGGVGEFEPVNGPLFSKELFTLYSMGKKKITIYINSMGGSVIDGMSIYSSIREAKEWGIKVDTYCVGVALSIAAIIFLAGDDRIMCDFSKLMFHDPFNVDGSIDKGLEEIRLSLVKMIAKDSGNDAEIEKMMHAETWINAEEAKSIGFATKINITSDKNKTMMDKKDKAVAKYEFGSLIMNKYIENNKTDITMSRKLTKNAEEIAKTEALKKLNAKNETKEEIFEEIQKVEETVEGIEEELFETSESDNEGRKQRQAMDENELSITHEMKNDDSEMYDDSCDEEISEPMMGEKDKMISDLKDELKVVCDELKKLKMDKAELEHKSVENKITNMLNGYIKAGKIKNDETTLHNWRESARKDYDFTVKLIDGLPVTKKAINFETNTGSVKNSTGPQIMALKMIELQNKMRNSKK